MWAIVGSNFYCPVLNSKSPLICIVGKQQKDHKPWSLNYCFFANQQVLFFAMPFLPYKGFALTGRLKTAKCERLWSMHIAKCECLRSRANCQVWLFVKQPNRHLQQLLAVENRTILHQLKPSTLYMMSQLTLIFYPHHTGMRSEMLYTNRSFEICQEQMFVKQHRKTAEAVTCCRKKYLCSSKNRQISTRYVLTP